LSIPLFPPSRPRTRAGAYPATLPWNSETYLGITFKVKSEHPPSFPLQAAYARRPSNASMEFRDLSRDATRDAAGHAARDNTGGGPPRYDTGGGPPRDAFSDDNGGGLSRDDTGGSLSRDAKWDGAWYDAVPARPTLGCGHGPAPFCA